jgi:DNA-binding SARP family transcriptional activator/tetratricopeptide (TPR) repeat protein
VYLCLEEGPHARPSLAELLYPYRTVENARTLLRQALFRLSGIGARYGSPLVATRDSVARNPDFPITSDYADFMDLSMAAVVENPSRLDHHRGPFLDEETDNNRSAWDGWVQDRRRTVDNQLARFYECLIRRAETLNDAEQALHWAESWMHQQPLSDAPHLLAMQLLARRGRSNEAESLFSAYQTRRITQMGKKAGNEVRAFHDYLRLTRTHTFTPEPVTVPAEMARHRFITLLAIRVDADTEEIPDDLLEAHLQHCWSLVSQVGHACGGVAHHAPDGVVELRFGLENALEDSPRHALRAAFELRRLAEPGHFPRIGMHCGRVLVAPDHTLTGSPLRVVRAAALANTEHMGLILTGAAHEALAHAFPMEGVAQTRSPVHVSGRGIPLFWLSTTQPPPLPKSGSAAFMGRDAECQRIHHLAATVLTERQGRILWIEGQAGIGKTRLMEEMAERLSQNMRVVRYACLPMYQHSLLHPIAVVIRDALNLSTLPPEKARDALQKLLQAIGEEDDLVYSVWCAWLGLEGDHAEMGLLRDYKKLLFDSVMLALTSHLFPMDRVLMFEDIHWADSASLEWLQAYLVHLHERTALLLVSTRRPIPGLQKIAIHETTLTLAPWDTHTARRYLRNLPHWTADHPTEESLIRQGCGVPLYLDSLARQTIFRGTSSELPHDIQSILEFTIAQSDFAQDLVQMAAVLGIGVSLCDLQSLLPDKTPEVLDHTAARLVDHGLWVATDQGWSYRHDLLREAVYDRIPGDRRQWLHQKVAQWLENHGPYDHGVLADHFEKGGEPYIAAQHHLLAGRQALRFSLYEVAALHYGRAGALLRDRPQDPDLLRAQTTYFLLLRLQRGHSTEMAQALDDLENTCLCQNHRGWHLLAAQYGRWIAENAANGALAGLHQARNLANTRFDPEVDPQLVAGVGHYVLGWNDLWLGHLEQAKAHLQQAVDGWHEAWAEPLFLAIGDRYREYAMAYLSIIDALQDRPAEGWERLAQVRHTLPDAKYGNIQAILWAVEIAMGYWADSPEDTWHIAQEVRQRDSYSLIIARTMTDAFAAWAEARLGYKSIPWAIHHIRRNLNMLRRVWRFGASSIYLVLLDLSVRSGYKHTHGVQFAARRLVRQHNIYVHKPEIKRLAAMQNKERSLHTLKSGQKPSHAQSCCVRLLQSRDLGLLDLSTHSTDLDRLQELDSFPLLLEVPL